MEGFTIYIVVFGTLAGVFGGAAVLIWFERRLLGIWQDRLGPNRVGPLGIGLALADIIKMFAKEDWVPPFADKFVFVFARIDVDAGAAARSFSTPGRVAETEAPSMWSSVSVLLGRVSSFRSIIWVSSFWVGARGALY